MKSIKYLFWILSIIYLFTAKGYVEASDTYYSIQTAKSIIADGDLKLSLPPSTLYTITGSNGEVYSKYGIGLALYYIPIVYIGHQISSYVHLNEDDLIGFFISFANLPFALLFLLFVTKILLHFRVNKHYIFLVIFNLGIGSLIWRYAVYDFSEMQQAAFLVVTIWGITTGSNKSIFWGGLALALLILLKVFSVIYVPFIFLYVFVESLKEKKLKKIILFTLPLVIGISFLFYLNYIRFGNALESGYGNESNSFIFSQLPKSIPALLFSIDKGIFFYCPLVLISILGWKPFYKFNNKLALIVLSMILACFISTAAWWSWYGGWSWGPRLLIPAIGFCVLPLAFWLKGEVVVWKKKLLVFTLVFGVIFQIPGIIVKDQEIHHIKEIVFNLKEEKQTPTDYITTLIVLKHKLNNLPEIYDGSDFNVQSKGRFNLENYVTYQGFNIWTEQLTKYIAIKWLKWLPILGLILIFFFFRKFFQEKNREQLSINNDAL